MAAVAAVVAAVDDILDKKIDNGVGHLRTDRTIFATCSGMPRMGRGPQGHRVQAPAASSSLARVAQRDMARRGSRFLTAVLGVCSTHLRKGEGGFPRRGR